MDIDYPTHLLGGNNVFGTGATANKSFPISVPHQEARVAIDFMKIDSWDYESARLLVDGAIMVSQALIAADGSSQCGVATAGWNESLVPITTKLAHSASSLSVNVTSTLDSVASDESWGIKRVQLGVRSPRPSLYAVNGPQLTAGSSNTTLTFDGTNFLAGATVSLNGTIYSTTGSGDRVSATGVTIPTLAGTPVAVLVINPSGAISNTYYFVPCQSGYVSNAGGSSAGSCVIAPTDGTTSISCSGGYTDSNGAAAGGLCTDNLVTILAGSICDDNYFDKNGNTTGGTCE